ncbi:MAG: hypothetical protein R6U98_34330 [Pirellulaceae bacterium]
MEVGTLLGFVIGTAAGLVLGLGTGMGTGIAMVHKKLKRMLEEGGIRVTDQDGNAVSGDELVALVQSKSRKEA